MKKRLLTGLMIIALTGCGDKGATVSSESDKDVLVFSQSSELRTLDPHQGIDVYSRRVMANVFDRLVEKDEQMELIPGLAESWKYLNDTTMEFKLREGVTFQNGTRFTSEDVKYTLDKARVSPMVENLFGVIEEVKVIDQYTVTIKTKEPYGPLLHHLSHITASIMNKDYNEANEDYHIKPMGTGAYRVEDWLAGDRVILKAHENYFRGKPPVNEIIVRNIPEENSRIIGLETGEVDMSQDIISMSRLTVLDHPSLELQEMSSLGVSYIGFNVKREPLHDVRVRQAIAYAINRDEIIDTILMGSVEKANGVFGPGVFGYSETAETIGYDLEKAKALLAEAGYESGGIELYVSISGGETSAEVMTVVQAQLRDIGINLTIEQLEWGAFLHSTANGESDLFYMSWSNSSADGDYGMSGILHSEFKGAGGNRSFYKNEELDNLIALGREELNQSIRQDYYAKAIDIVNEEVPIYPLNFTLANAGYSNKVKGYVQSPLNNPNFFKLYFE